VFSYLIPGSLACGNQKLRIRRYFVCWGWFFFGRSLAFFFVPANVTGGGQSSEEERRDTQYEDYEKNTHSGQLILQ
jgi:hypothetical protein